MLFADSSPQKALGLLDFTVVGIYLATMFAMALYFSKRQKSTEEFFLASRQMPWFAVGLSIIATLLSTVTFLGSPGEMIKHGVGIFWGILAVPFCMVVVFFLWIPFFMRLRMTSVYEYLELRFNYSARVVAAVLFILLRLGWMGVVVYTSSLALTTMTVESFAVDGIVSDTLRQNYMYGVIAVVGLFATVYTTVGGFRAVIWTDVIQFIVLFGGALLTLGYVMFSTGTGPIDWWTLAAEHRAQHTNPPVFSLDPTERVTIVTACIHVFVWTICTHACDQVVLQRYFSTPSLKAAAKSYFVSAVAEVSVGMLLGLCGLALLAFYLLQPDFLPAGLNPTSNETADEVFPYFIAHQLPPGVGGLILAALIAAAMSSIDSGANSVSTVITTDFFERLSPGGQQKLSSLALARILTLIIGTVATLLAYWVVLIGDRVNIVELSPKAFNIFLGPLAGLFFMGMFLPHCGSRSAILAAVLGFVCAFFWNYWGNLFPEAERVPSFTLGTAVPLAITVMAGAIFGYLFKEPDGRQAGSEYSWLAVIRRK